MSDRDEILDEALKVFGKESPSAREDVIRVADQYREMIENVYSGSAQFSEVREELKKERKQALKLAYRIDAITKRVEPLLTTFGQLPDEIDRVIGERLELSARLLKDAAWIESLEEHWPKGGQGKNLTTAYYGHPHAWLIAQCIWLIKQHGDESAIQPARNYQRNQSQLLLYDLVCYVYELATGKEGAEAEGLAWRINEMVAQLKSDEKRYRSRIEWGTTDGGVKYVKSIADE